MIEALLIVWKPLLKGNAVTQIGKLPLYGSMKVPTYG